MSCLKARTSQPAGEPALAIPPSGQGKTGTPASFDPRKSFRRSKCRDPKTVWQNPLLPPNRIPSFRAPFLSGTRATADCGSAPLAGSTTNGSNLIDHIHPPHQKCSRNLRKLPKLCYRTFPLSLTKDFSCNLHRPIPAVGRSFFCQSTINENDRCCRAIIYAFAWKYRWDLCERHLPMGLYDQTIPTDCLYPNCQHKNQTFRLLGCNVGSWPQPPPVGPRKILHEPRDARYLRSRQCLLNGCIHPKRQSSPAESAISNFLPLDTWLDSP